MTTIVCWNMQHKRESWRFLRDQRGDADIALLQEACTPPDDVADTLGVGPGPWVHSGWNGARAVVRLSDGVTVERLSVDALMASAAQPTDISSPAELAAAIVHAPGLGKVCVVSVEMSHETAPKLPRMVRDIQRYCGGDLPVIVGGDLTTWWDSKTTVFGDMMRIGVPLVGPHAATFYSPLHRQTPLDAELQLDYVFASRGLHERIAVRALNGVDEWGPSDHCRVVIDVADA